MFWRNLLPQLSQQKNNLCMIERHMLYRRKSRNHTEWMGHHGPKRGPIHQWQSTGEDWVTERSENKLFLKKNMYVWGISVAKRENRTSCTSIICHYTDKIVSTWKSDLQVQPLFKIGSDRVTCQCWSTMLRIWITVKQEIDSGLQTQISKGGGN